jgi:hypothetical protein
MLINPWIWLSQLPLESRVQGQSINIYKFSHFAVNIVADMYVILVQQFTWYGVIVELSSLIPTLWNKTLQAVRKFQAFSNLQPDVWRLNMAI